jgi:signal peptidase I
MQVDQYRPAADFTEVVKPGHYFMMGDNRDNSSDSRVWGQVPERDIVGRAFAIWMHWESLLSVPSFSRVGVIQ